MTRPGYADRAALRAWADRQQSGAEFPRLIRRLIIETTPGLVELGFPAGDGVSIGGWDGTVATTEGSTWVPKGRSLWELSTEKSVRVKADDDYQKRRSEPLVENPIDHVYVAGSLRAWTKRDEWADHKRVEGLWRDVRAHGLDDIDTWLESAPATWAWFSEQQGLKPHGVRTATSWWDIWSNQTKPGLSSGLVLSGREAAVMSVADRLNGAGFIATIGGASQDDVCAFLAACAIATDQAGNGDMAARTVLVDEIAAWRGLLSEQRPLVLIPLHTEFAHEVPPGSPHQVFVPTDRTGAADIAIPSLDASSVRDRLRDSGVEDDRLAEEYGRLARRSLTTLRRRLGVSAALSSPDWSRRPVSRTTRAALLAGAWVDDAEGDEAALADLAGCSYEDFVEVAQALTSLADPLLSRFDGEWHLVDAVDAWAQIGGAVTKQDLQRLTSVFSTVLGEVDPALDLPADERWWRAAFDGKQRRSSSRLRAGLANTLALLGEFGGSIPAGQGSSAADLASGVVRRLLADANEDASGNRWISIADLLPLLAEAAPDAFLGGVQDGLNRSDPVLAKMFVDDSDPMFASGSSHSALLWALETAAWSAPHLGLATEVIAHLAEIDPGGRLANRPASSLTSIFCVWHPENSATDGSRIRIIDAIRNKHPDVAWPWIMSLLPELHGFHTPTSTPKYRDWKPAGLTVTYSAIWAFNSALVERAIEDASSSVQRWLDLADKMFHLSSADRAIVLEGLRTKAVTQAVFNEEETRRLWEKLRSVVSHHRTYSDTDWAGSDSELAAVDHLADELAPSGALQRHQWLFGSYHPELGDVKRLDDHEVYESELRLRRSEAVLEILDEGGLEAVTALASQAEQAWPVGVALADADDDFDPPLLAQLGTVDLNDKSLAMPYFSRRFSQRGWHWLDALIELQTLSPLQQARLLRMSHDLPSAWDRADQLGEETAISFWREFQHWGLGQDFDGTETAARRLAQAGRHAVAIDLVTIYSRNVSDLGPLARLVADSLDAILNEPEREAQIRALGHGLERAFEIVEGCREIVGIDRVAALEWAYLPALGHEPSIPSLSESLAISPDRFVEVVRTAYRRQGVSDEDREDSDQVPGDSEPEPPVDPSLARNAFSLLSAWKQPPGLDAGDVNENALNEWVDQAIEKLAEADRLDIGLICIGHVLTFFPPTEDGTRPPLEVARLIERVASAQIEDGYFTQTLNSRGVTSRGLEDGGDQEEVLARDFGRNADNLADDHPRTAAVLRRIADSYEREARRNDVSAERFKRGLR